MVFSTFEIPWIKVYMMNEETKKKKKIAKNYIFVESRFETKDFVFANNYIRMHTARLSS